MQTTPAEAARGRGSPVRRLRLSLEGAVQGVGFRPFVYKLAMKLDLKGWVSNSVRGVTIEIEGPVERLECFSLDLMSNHPPFAFIDNLSKEPLNPVGDSRFYIKESFRAGEISTLVLPDFATCEACRQEIFDPRNRRHLYPFTNCTDCGPRYSILERLPYDRLNTSMRKFTMCEECQNEYDDPEDRRFHAQPNACPRCGPHMELWNRTGRVLQTRQSALSEAASAIKMGKIVAVKGLGGFHLFADATHAGTVQKLRRRKHREAKPFALMFPNLTSIRQVSKVSPEEETLLHSEAAPIVLLHRRECPEGRHLVAEGISDNAWLGIMLPANPLHHLLMHELSQPVIATSGNLVDEPLCTDESEAIERLGGIADIFLVHNRPIVHHGDDSIVRTIRERPMILRRARGYAPLPVSLKKGGPSVLAVGAHQKNTVALNVGRKVFISQHIGDLETGESLKTFRKSLQSLEQLYAPELKRVVCDKHPDYASTDFARNSSLHKSSLQHHHAHILACMGENLLEGKVLGIAWDGNGLGDDGTLWGGEFLLAEPAGFRRFGHFKTFRLPGAGRAVREPRRTALSLLMSAFKDDFHQVSDLPCLRELTPHQHSLMRKMLQRGINAPFTSSVGRLFDGVAALSGLCQHNRYEGEAAMTLENALTGIQTEERYSFSLLTETDNEQKESFIIDWRPMIREIVEDIQLRNIPEKIAAKFHNTLISAALIMAQKAGQERIVLSGGCFQNTYLLEGLIRHLHQEGFTAYWHRNIPPNDGGIAFGQAVFGIYQEDSPCV